MMQPGRKNLITDRSGRRVGNASADRIKSGVTVITADTPFTAGVNIMGGAPGSRETALLDPDKLVCDVDAIVLAGGSAFGLDAASGVMQGLRDQGRGFAVGEHRIPIVPAAILFDLNNGGEGAGTENPYPRLGLDALNAAGPQFDLGTAGAGTGAIAGDYKGGLGSASIVLEGGITVAAIVAVNSLGSAIVPHQGRFWAAPFECDDEFGGLGMASQHDALTEPDLPKLNGANTTIAVVATDAALDKAGCQRMATAAHDGMARALVPSHTPFDGDCIFGIATGEGAMPGPLDQLRIGHAASLCLSRAIARGVYHATGVAGDPMPAFRDQLA